MQDLLASTEGCVFDFEDYIKQKLGIGTKSAQKCKYFLRGKCPNGPNCIYRHGKNEKAVVCKHWLRGLCKKGEACEFLHEYNLKKMPECWFFSKYGECSNAECQYLHIDPTVKAKECLWYSRGFCKHGPHCRNRHIKRVLCKLFMAGFCPYGRRCEEAHPNHEQLLTGGQQGEERNAHSSSIHSHHTNYAGNSGNNARTTPTCYKCGASGHYANRCTGNEAAGRHA